MKQLDIFLRDWRICQAGQFIGQGATVLDIGTGDGALFEKVKQISWGAGVDPLITNVIEHNNYTLYPGSFPAAFDCAIKFDVITMLAVLEHFPQTSYHTLASRCAQLLMPEGLLIITVPSAHVDSLLQLMKWLGLIDGMNIDEHHGFDPQQTRVIFTAPIFRLIHYKRFQLGLNCLFVFRRMDEQPVTARSL